MKAYADERRNAQRSSIKIGDRVLKQNRGDTLTPAHDLRPHAVVGVKGSMITVKRGKEIKSRNSFDCKVFKYAGKEEYDVFYWDQERQPAKRHTEVGELPGEGNIVMQEVHSRPTTAPPEHGDQYEPELLRGKPFTETLSHTKEKGGGLVSRPPTPCSRPHGSWRQSNYYARCWENVFLI